MNPLEKLIFNRKNAIANHLASGRPVIFVARLEKLDACYDNNQVYFEAFFSTSEKAEAAIAKEQAKIASECHWLSEEDGESSLSNDDGEYRAVVYRELVDAE